MPVPRPSYPMIAARQLEMIARESGIPDELVGSVSKLLRKVLDKQAIDERLNYQWLSDNSPIPPFSYSGALAVTTVDACPPWPMEAPVKSMVVTGYLDTDGSSNSVFTIYKNRSSIATLTIPSGDTEASTTITIPYNIGDLLQVATTTAGTGAMSALLHFIPR